MVVVVVLCCMAFTLLDGLAGMGAFSVFVPILQITCSEVCGCGD